jgi:hypothetical protein
VDLEAIIGYSMLTVILNTITTSLSYGRRPADQLQDIGALNAALPKLATSRWCDRREEESERQAAICL